MKIGVIGLGHWGRNYIRVFNELQAFDEIIACDKKKDINLPYKNCRFCSNAQSIFDDKQVENIVIATPSSTHFEFLAQAMNAGKNILVEKPVVMKTEQRKKLLNWKYDKMIFVGHTFLYNNAVQYIKEFLQKEDIGQVYSVSCKRVHLGLIREDVNVLWDLAPHDISILNYWFGSEPEVLSAYGGAFLKKDREDMVYATLRYDKILVSLYLSWVDTNKERNIEIVGSRAKVVFDDIDMQAPVKIFKKGVGSSYYNTTFGDYQYLFRNGDIIIPSFKMGEPLKNMCEHFVKCIRGEEMPRPLAKSLKVSETIEKMQEVMRGNQKK